MTVPSGPAPGPEVEEAETSRAEKLLAIGLVIFLLIGGFWVVDRLGSLPKPPDYQAISDRLGLSRLSEEYQRLSGDYARGVEAAQQAQGDLNKARAEYEYRREEYRVGLERGVNDPALARAHEAARAAFETAQARYDLTEAVRASLEERLAGPQAAYEEAEKRVRDEFKRAQDRYQFLLFAIRFGYALPLFGLSVWGWLALRRRRSRHLILATSFMAFAGIQALGLVGQYGWYLLRDIGPIALSVTGSAICVAGLVAVRRWAFGARRLVSVRLRRHQCPYCGFPMTPGLMYCAGCGRKLTEPCPRCGKDTVIQASFCPHCGLERG